MARPPDGRVRPIARPATFATDDLARARFPAPRRTPTASRLR